MDCRLVRGARSKDEGIHAFALDDVKGADFIPVKADHAPGAPVFAMNEVTDFNLYLSRPIRDTHWDHEEHEDL